MKKFLILLCALTLVLAMTMSASAALVTITFDEPGISAYVEGVTGTHLLDDGVTEVYDQGDGDLITNQYAAWGVVWIVDPITEQPHNEVTMGEMFNNEFDVGSTNQILWYNGNPVEGNIQLDFLADSLAFDYRKPSGTAADPVQVKLYNGLTEVYDSGVFSAIGEWQTFTYNATDPSGYFDRIQMYSPTNKKFLIDDLEVNTVTGCTVCDLNDDGVCDEEDLAMFSDGYDLNGDGKIDAADGVMFNNAYEKPQCGYGICDCEVVPDAPQVPRGGILGFDVSVTNMTGGRGYVNFGTKVTKPNGVQTAFVWGPFQVGLASYQSKSGHKIHMLPINFPLGTSTYRGYVQLTGRGVIAECEFNFEVVEAAPF